MAGVIELSGSCPDGEASVTPKAYDSHEICGTAWLNGWHPDVFDISFDPNATGYSQTAGLLRELVSRFQLVRG